jgi:hypothetical protein
MKKYLLLIFLLPLLFSCSDPDVIVVPDSVLPKEKMADVMVDIHLLEATLNIHAGGNDKDLVPAKINIYEKHQISKTQFEESYKFYTENPELLAEIYQKVLDNLSKLQAETMNK